MLAMVGAALASGCTARGGQQNETSAQNNSTNQSGPQNELTCEPDIQFTGAELLVDDSGFTTDAYAEIIVENAGTARSGEVAVTAGWLDQGGNFLDEDTARLPSLAAGETWQAYVVALGPDAESIEDVQVSGEFVTGAPVAPSGLAVAESQYVAEDDQIRGRVTIDRETSVEEVTALAKLYAEDGTVLGGGTAWESELAAGTDWRFEMYVPRLPGDAPEPTDHEVLLDAGPHQIQMAGDGD